MATTVTRARIDLYADVTQRIVAELETGVEAWTKSWSSAPDRWRPINTATGRAYRGINVLLCHITMQAGRHRRNRWLTFQQALSLGGNVRKGARGTRLIYWMEVGRSKSREEERAPETDAETVEDSEERCSRLVCKHFTVFNVADCEGLDDAEEEALPAPELADHVIRASGATILEGEPSYWPAEDIVRMPPASAFQTRADYHATAYHELVHWTAPRVGRVRNTKRWGDDAYAVEELCAELGSAMVCGAAGVPASSQAAAYLHGWLRVLKTDSRAIFTVAGQAQRAADYLLVRAGLVATDDAQTAA